MYHFISDVDACFPVQCENGGECIDGVSSYMCNCPAGYTGDHCETGNKNKTSIQNFNFHYG